MFLTEKDNLIALSTGKHTVRNIKLTQPALLSFSNKKHRQSGAFPAEKARFTGYHQGFCRHPQGVPYFSRCARAPPLVSGGRASLRSHEPAGFLILSSTSKRHRKAVPFAGVAKGIRTPDLLNAIQTRYQLRYNPVTDTLYRKMPVKSKQFVARKTQFLCPSCIFLTCMLYSKYPW